MIVKIIMKGLECTKCGNAQTIFRKMNKNKKEGHRKGLWCPTCKKKTKHVELNEFEPAISRRGLYGDSRRKILRK